MTYLLQSRFKKGKGKYKKWLVLALFLAIIGSSFYFEWKIPKFVQGSVQFLSSPLWKGRNSIENSAQKILGFFSDKISLVEENVSLKRELIELSPKILDRNLLEEENIRLREILGRNTVDDLSEAQILVRPPSSPYDTLIIDLGKSSGITEGDFALAGGTVVIGRVDRIFRRTSIVKLFSTPGETIDVRLARSFITAVAEGKGGGNFEIIIPREIESRIGDEILIPGLNTSILGTVRHIESDDSDAFKRLLIISPVNLAELDYIFIKKSTTQNESR